MKTWQYIRSIRESPEPAQSLDRVENRLAEFNGASGAIGSCQFGPRPQAHNNDRPTDIGPRPLPSDDQTINPTTIVITTADQMASATRNSTGDGKIGIVGKQDSFVHYNWGNTKVDNARTTEARLKRMEEDNIQLRTELDMYKQQIETRQIVTVAMDIPATKPADVKSTMAMIKNGGTTIINTTTQHTITNSVIARRDRSPESEEPPGNQGGFFKLARGNGSGPSGNGDDPDNGDTQTPSAELKTDEKIEADNLHS